MFAKCGMNTEAMNQYNYILKNKLLPVPNRLWVRSQRSNRSLIRFSRRINIGNIYLNSKQYGKALKMYRMALDQIPEQNADLKWEKSSRESLSPNHMTSRVDSKSERILLRRIFSWHSMRRQRKRMKRLCKNVRTTEVASTFCSAIIRSDNGTKLVELLRICWKSLS